MNTIHNSFPETTPNASHPYNAGSDLNGMEKGKVSRNLKQVVSFVALTAIGLSVAILIAFFGHGPFTQALAMGTLITLLAFSFLALKNGCKRDKMEADYNKVLTIIENSLNQLRSRVFKMGQTQAHDNECKTFEMQQFAANH